MARTHQPLMVKLVLEKCRRDEPTNFTSYIAPNGFKKPAPDLNPGEITLEVPGLEVTNPYIAASGQRLSC